MYGCGVRRFALMLGRRDRAWSLVLIMVALCALNLGYFNNPGDPDQTEKRRHVQRLDHTTVPPTGSDRGYGSCKPHKATIESRALAKELYYLDPALRRCKSASVEICSLKFVEDSRVKRLKPICSSTACGGENVNVSVHGLDPSTGRLVFQRSFPTTRQLQAALPGIATQAVRAKFPFLYLKCVRWRSNTELSQLLPISPELALHSGKNPRRSDVISVNVVLIDSVSRAHFYRSLPNTAQLFDTWASQPSTAPAAVLDFELFQAVHGHTTENTRALFTGKVRRLQATEESATNHVGIDVLLGLYKRAGYQTMWQEDLCWKAGWGLVSDLDASNWTDLQEKTRRAAIDHTGLTHSSCELLTSLGVETPFNGPSDDQICYNGNFQHSYLLTYSKQAFQAVGSSAGSRPLFSYLALNVGHDDTGRRIQSLDAALSDYLTHLAQDSHSLTILLADHGNTYTAYTTTLEGRFEMFHPSLFVVVPKHVTKLLGPRAMSALKINQRRLATAVDLHHSLKALAGPLVGGVKAEGVFAEISPNRTCRDVELRTPNLCVCDGWDSPTTNDSSKLALAEFAVGQLNNQMQKRYMARLNTAANNAGTPAAKLPLLRSCQRLQPLRIENVRERNSGIGGYLTTTMDVHVVGATKIGERAEEVFNVEVRSREMNNDTSLHLELVHYERLTQYGHYGACADEGVPPKLCVCSRSRNSSKRKTLDEISWARYASFFGEKYSLTVLPDQKCLAFFRRRHAHGRSVAYEAANICEHERFLISFNAEVENMKVSRDVPFVVEVPPGSVTFLMSARVHVPYWKWTVEEEVEVVSSIKI